MILDLNQMAKIGFTVSLRPFGGWYRKAAEHGVAPAQFNMAVCYFMGQGVSRDEVESYKWVLLTSSQGFDAARLKMSELESRLPQELIAKGQQSAADFQAVEEPALHDIVNLPEGYCETAGLLAKAEARDAGVQNDLGELLFSGSREMIRDPVAAVIWFRQAANQNHVAAQRNLGLCYERGEGVPKQEAHLGTMNNFIRQHISPTAAKSYLSCSLRFWFERVACIRKATTPALHLGKVVHAALQAFHIARWRGGDHSPEAVAAAYEAAFLRHERDEGPVNFEGEAEREKCRLDGLRVVAAYLDSPEAMQEKPRAVGVLLREDIPGLSVPLTGAMDLVEGNFTPVDFKSASSKPDPDHAAFDHELQLVSYQLLLEAIGETPPSLDLVFLVKTKTPQVIRVKSPPADTHRKQRVTALLETAVEGIASGRHHLQPGIQCSWCQYRNECKAWLPGMTVESIHRMKAA